MLEPKSKLPWEVDKCFHEKKNNEECWCAVINDATNSDGGVCGYGSVGKQDAAYIVEAANNYPLAVKLLKVINNHLDNNFESTNDLQLMIENFMKRVNENK